MEFKTQIKSSDDCTQNQHFLFKKIRAGNSDIARAKKVEICCHRNRTMRHVSEQKKDMCYCVSVSSWVIDLNQYCLVLLEFC